MEPRRAAPTWRALFGIGLTAVAAVLLALSLWQAFRLSADAGTGVATLKRERAAVQFEHALMALFIDLNRYRVRTQMLRQAPAYPGLRAQIDREIASVDASARSTNDLIRMLPDWQKVRGDWITARSRSSAAVPASDAAVRDLGQALLYRLEDVSGLEYETDRATQDLADMYFAKLPAAIAELMHADFLGENAQAGGSLSIPNRIMLARLLDSASTDQGDLDLTTDEWGSVLSTARREGVASSVDVSRYERDNAGMRAAGDKFMNALNAQVVVKAQPSGNAASTRASADSAVAATVTMSRDVYGLLDGQLAHRVRVKTEHDRYLYAAAACGAALVLGIMLLVSQTDGSP